MKTSDISDKAVVEFLAKNPDKWHTWGKGHSMPTVRDAMPEGTPEKLQLSKMKALIKKGLVDGCGCGCRGDFVITPKGLELLSLGVV